VLKWAEVILQPGYQPKAAIDTDQLSFQHFETTFLQELEKIGIGSNPKSTGS
jgi:hypothetical protein